MVRHPRHGRDADDATPALAGHGAHQALHPEEGGGEVGGEDVVPVLLGHGHDELVPGDAGVVDENLHGAELGDDRLTGLGDGDGVRDVNLVGLGLETLGDGLAGSRLGDAEDRVPMGRKPLGDRLADAPAGSGDEGDAGRVREMHREGFVDSRGG
jgi:hypothetical protein